MAPWRGMTPVGLGDVRATRAVRVAVDLDAGGDVGLGAEVHPAQLILDVRERLEHLAVGERVADATFAVGAVAARAAGVHRRRLRRADRRPSAVAGVSARTYMNAHSGKMLSVAIAQNGIFLRALAAATTGMSGLAAADRRARPARRPRGGLQSATAGAVAAGAVLGAAAALSAARGARLRPALVRPCCASAGARESRSRVHDRRRDVEIRKSSRRIARTACTSSQPCRLSASGVVDRNPNLRVRVAENGSRRGTGDYSLCSSSRSERTAEGSRC